MTDRSAAGRGMVVAAALVLAGQAGAEASEPVRRTIVGCVSDGRFVSSDGYVIRPTDAAGRHDVDLARWEGRRLSLTGDLLPGDLLRLRRPPKELGRCR